jgi:3-hydroxyacyl-CoA dehydrogenase
MARDERRIRKVVVLGANGAMGSGSGEVFAAAGIHTVFLARTRDKAREGQERAEKLAKADALSRFISIGSYDEDLEREVADADLIFEAVGEELDLKRRFFSRIDARRKPDAIVATVSSGLSIAGMCLGLSASFRRHFLGIHFFNPPNVIVGCELVPHAQTDPQVAAFVWDLLTQTLGRELIKTSDTPAFLGNRVGFKVLNECAQLAAVHGTMAIDALIGPHTGRAMAPLATIDFVGWDVHKAIVDNLFAHTADEAHAAFALPAPMNELIGEGHLGDKSPAQGGFFRRTGKGKDAETSVLDLATRTYRPAKDAARPLPEVAAKMKALHRVGRYVQAFDVFAEAPGADAELMRRVILGYVSYGLGRVGEVVEQVADVDRIMGFGFNWAPPGVLVDVIGARRTVRLLEAAKLPVPRPIVAAAEAGAKLFREPHVDIGRFFFA